MNSKLPFHIFAQIKERLEKASRVAIFAHKNPDGDAIGSTTALALALEQIGVKNDLICIDKPGRAFQFIEKTESFLRDFNPADYDLGVILDAGDLQLISFGEIYPDFFAQVPIIKIDHHPNGHFEPEIKWIDASYASVTEMLVDLFKFCKIKITPEIATSLLTGLYTDTGSFQHSNTTVNTLRTTAYLLRCGGSYRSIAKSVFQTIPFSTLKLWGRVLSRIEKNEEGVVFSAVTKKDYEECHASREELAGAVDYLNAVEGNYSILLTEENDRVKASLRTKSDQIDVSSIAKKFGGGGHVKAAGFAVPGKLKAETHWRVVDANAQ